MNRKKKKLKVCRLMNFALIAELRTNFFNFIHTYVLLSAILQNVPISSNSISENRLELFYFHL